MFHLLLILNYLNLVGISQVLFSFCLIKLGREYETEEAEGWLWGGVYVDRLHVSTIYSKCKLNTSILTPKVLEISSTLD